MDLPLQSWGAWATKSYNCVGSAIWSKAALGWLKVDFRSGLLYSVLKRGGCIGAITGSGRNSGMEKLGLWMVQNKNFFIWFWMLWRAVFCGARNMSTRRNYNDVCNCSCRAWTPCWQWEIRQTRNDTQRSCNCPPRISSFSYDKQFLLDCRIDKVGYPSLQKRNKKVLVTDSHVWHLLDDVFGSRNSCGWCQIAEELGHWASRVFPAYAVSAHLRTCANDAAPEQIEASGNDYWMNLELAELLRVVKLTNV